MPFCWRFSNSAKQRTVRKLGNTETSIVSLRKAEGTEWTEDWLRTRGSVFRLCSNGQGSSPYKGWPRRRDDLVADRAFSRRAPLRWISDSPQRWQRQVIDPLSGVQVNKRFTAPQAPKIQVSPGAQLALPWLTPGLGRTCDRGRLDPDGNQGLRIRDAWRSEGFQQCRARGRSRLADWLGEGIGFGLPTTGTVRQRRPG